MRFLRTKAFLLGLAIVYTLASILDVRSVAEITIKPVATSDDHAVVGANSVAFENSFSESGLFYSYGQRMWYLDYSTNRSYVLCSLDGCSHSDISCSAWYGLAHDGYGLAQYGDHIYAMRRNRSNNTYELIEMSLDAGSQRLVCAIDVGEFIHGSWIFSGITRGSVLYAGGYAWFEAAYQYCEVKPLEEFYNTQFCYTIIGINLESGELRSLYDLSLDDSITHTLQLVTGDYLVIEETWDKDPALSEEKFVAALVNGEFPQFQDAAVAVGAAGAAGAADIPEAKEAYERYLCWHSNTRTVEYSYLIYDIASSTKTPFASGEMRNNYPEVGGERGYSALGVDEHGNAYGDDYLERGHFTWRDSGYRFLDAYNGQIIYSEYEFDQPVGRTTYSKLSCLDPATGTTESILEIVGGDVLQFQAGCVTKEGDIRFLIYTDHDTAVFYRYSLVAGLTKELFEDVWNITFRVHAETEDCFVGSMLKNMDDRISYIISKDDYYSGNFGAAVRLNK